VERSRFRGVRKDREAKSRNCNKDTHTEKGNTAYQRGGGGGLGGRMFVKIS